MSDWRIEPFTQIFNNNATARVSKVYKVHRRLNATVDSSLLGRHYRKSAQHVQMLEFSCSNLNHVPQCHWLGYKLYMM